MNKLFWIVPLSLFVYVNLGVVFYIVAKKIEPDPDARLFFSVFFPLGIVIVFIELSVSKLFLFWNKIFTTEDKLPKAKTINKKIDNLNKDW